MLCIPVSWLPKTEDCGVPTARLHASPRDVRVAFILRARPFLQSLVFGAPPGSPSLFYEGRASTDQSPTKRGAKADQLVLGTPFAAWQTDELRLWEAILLLPAAFLFSFLGGGFSSRGSCHALLVSDTHAHLSELKSYTSLVGRNPIAESRDAST